MDHIDLDGNLLLARRPVAGRRASATACSCPPTLPGSASRPRRLLVLAEGRSGDPHFGKTARGVMRYRPERRRRAARLDAATRRASRASRSSRSVAEALPSSRRPRSSASPRRAGASRPPGAAAQGVPRGGPRPRERPARVRLRRSRARRPRCGARRGAARPAQAAAGLDVPTGANLTHGATTILTVGSDCAIGKMTVALELDREARRRGHRSEFVPTGQTGIAIAGWGSRSTR